MGVDIELEYSGDLHCLAVHGPSGSRLVTDAPVDNGGKGEAFSPTDLVATAAVSCILTVMGLVGKRNGLDLSGLRGRVTKEMASAPLRRIGRLQIVIDLPAGLAPADRKKLEAAAASCPVKQSLHPDVVVDLTFRYS